MSDDREGKSFECLSLSAHFEKTQTDSGWNTRDSRGISPRMVDFDDDGEVSILDYLALSGNYGQEGETV